MAKKRDLKIHTSESVKLLEDFWYKFWRHKPTGGKQALGEGKVGTELHRDSNTYRYRRRNLNKSNPHAEDSYQEEIRNPSTGYVKRISMKLADHKRHGSAIPTLSCQLPRLLSVQALQRERWGWSGARFPWCDERTGRQGTSDYNRELHRRSEARGDPRRSTARGSHRR